MITGVGCLRARLRASKALLGVLFAVSMASCQSAGARSARARPVVESHDRQVALRMGEWTISESEIGADTDAERTRRLLRFAERVAIYYAATSSGVVVSERQLRAELVKRYGTERAAAIAAYNCDSEGQFENWILLDLTEGRYWEYYWSRVRPDVEPNYPIPPGGMRPEARTLQSEETARVLRGAIEWLRVEPDAELRFLRSHARTGE